MNMKLKILSVGKIKERYIQEGINEYAKRLQRFCAPDFVVIKDSTVEKEAKAINEKISNDYVVVLDAGGRQYSSVEFSNVLKKINKNIVFVIGNENGLSDDIKKKAHLTLSLSQMTFLHEMTQLILVEQIYRAFSIMKNTWYHK